MKKSINAWAFPEEMTFEDIFETAKKYGFEAIELNVDAIGANKHSFNYESTEADFNKVLELDFVNFSVSSNHCCYVLVISLIDYCFCKNIWFCAKKSYQFINCVNIWSFNLF